MGKKDDPTKQKMTDKELRSELSKWIPMVHDELFNQEWHDNAVDGIMKLIQDHTDNILDRLEGEFKKYSWGHYDPISIIESYRNK